MSPPITADETHYSTEAVDTAKRRLLPVVEACVAVDLAFTETGAGRPLVILHGLLGSKRNWSTLAATFGASQRVLVADLRNHGESPRHEMHDYPALAADVARLIEEEVGEPAAVMGHSMGGKAAMTLALDRPDLVERLVVVDIAPARSNAAPLALLRAMRAVPLGSCTSRAEVGMILAETIADPGVRAFVAQNVVTGPAGLAWSVNLDALERHVESILGFPHVPVGRAFTGPTLFVAGGRSDYLRPDHAGEIGRLFPHATIETIPDAGHWVHAEAPAAFLRTVSRFLAAPA